MKTLRCVIIIRMRLCMARVGFVELTYLNMSRIARAVVRTAIQTDPVQQDGCVTANLYSIYRVLTVTPEASGTCWGGGGGGGRMQTSVNIQTQRVTKVTVGNSMPYLLCEAAKPVSKATKIANQIHGCCSEPPTDSYTSSTMVRPLAATHT